VNAKLIKKINRKADSILMDWLKGMTPEEDHHRITKDSLYSFLPSANYFYADNHMWLSFYSPKWTKKTIKKLVSLGVDVDSISMQDLENYRARNREKED
tara:strand:- start:22 stop:318 length:297 start_codon:yes stop_codon:yes gene_type:complete